MIRYTYTLLLAVILLSACTAKKKEDVKVINIMSISFQTETMFTISCEKFDTYYSDKWKTASITNKVKIAALTKLLYGLKRIDNGYEPNVRAKLLLVQSTGTIDTVCLDDKVTRYKGTSYETSVEFANMVQEMK